MISEGTRGDEGEAIGKVPNAMVDRRGQARIGTYRGELVAVQLERLRGEEALGGLQARLRRKRWQYSALCTDEVFVAQAVVHAGFAGNAFMYAIDLREERLVLRASTLGLPGVQVAVNNQPGAGLEASFRGPGQKIWTRRPPQGAPYEVGANLSRWGALPYGAVDLRAHLSVVQAAPALTVIAPVAAPGRLNVTQKWMGLPARGRLQIASRSYELAGGLGALDYTQGFLGRRTAWRWAMALGRLDDGRRLGLNLVEGFNDDHPTANENALWVGDRLIGLGRARFTYQKDRPGEPWQVRTTCGRVELSFRSIYVHREVRNIGPVRSSFLQPAGRFEGTIKVDNIAYPVRLVGVTEDQDIWW
ncbi:DUF2804 domain-containing protein [Lujinxingia litoralis]|uniref:DUF2804 domain-containing protein n=1 Tax=Lujinxingia litoralis TaxID=2211119 RepID=UPI001314CCEE|nr:DUF2804 domain-containing protein [Lujinxingia litoralis]